MGKGGISIPPYLAASMIIMVIVIGVAYLFLTGIGENLLQVFEKVIVKGIQDIMCGSVPIVGQWMCS